MTGSRQIAFASMRRAPRRRWTRVGGIVLALAAVAGLVTLVLAASLWTYAATQLGGERFPSLDDPVAALGSGEPLRSPGTTTVLVVLTAAADPAASVTPELRGPVLLVQGGGIREVPAVLALPTDLPLTVDGEPMTSIADVHGRGDVDALIPAVADYTGVRIDHVVSASEELLPELVELQRPEICAGACREVTTGDVRTAQTEGSSPERVLATASLLRAVAAELDAPGALLSPVTSKRTIDVVGREVRTDVSLRGGALLELARRFVDAPEPEVAAVPLLQHPETGRAVLLEQAETLFQRLRDGSPLADPDEDTPADATPAELAGTVDVAVLNGAGIDGLAGRLEARLAAEGFRVVGTGNAPALAAGGQSVISYDAGDPIAEVAAILLAERLEGAALDPAPAPPTFDGRPVGVVVTAGADLAEGR